MSFRDRRTSPDLTGDLQWRRGEGLRDPENAGFPVPRFGHGSRVPGWDKVFGFYFQRIVPLLGGLVTRDRAAYTSAASGQGPTSPSR